MKNLLASPRVKRFLIAVAVSIAVAVGAQLGLPVPFLQYLTNCLNTDDLVACVQGVTP